MEVKSVFIKHLLLPIILVITTTIAALINKKNQILNNKQFILIVLSTSLVLTIPSILGLLGLNFMPSGFIISQFFYLLMGIIFLIILFKYFEDMIFKYKLFLLMIYIIITLLTVYVYFNVYNFFSDDSFGIWASGSIITFLLPILFWYSFESYVKIPIPIYKHWGYPEDAAEINLYGLDLENILVLELEFFKNPTDVNPLRVKVKAPSNMVFGNWFQKFIEDYNLKNPTQPLSFKNEEQVNYKWIFYVKNSFYKKNLYIDPSLDIKDNLLTDKMTIHAKRVLEQI